MMRADLLEHSVPHEQANKLADGFLKTFSLVIVR